MEAKYRPHLSFEPTALPRRNTKRMVNVIFLFFALILFDIKLASAEEPAPRSVTQHYEMRFLKQMIDHHHMAVMMAEMCLEKASHEELKSACATMIADQQQEIDKMHRWLREWYGLMHEPVMSPADLKRMELLGQLDAAAFEVAFMRAMVKHHWEAVVKSVHCVGQAYHEELSDLCESIATKQIEEIVQLKVWLRQWYGIRHTSPHLRTSKDD